MDRILNFAPYPRPKTLSEEEKAAATDALLSFLLRERGLIGAFSASYRKKRDLLRGYFNQRMPMPVPEEIIKTQDELLWTETIERGIVEMSSLAFGKQDVAVWEGDITRLAIDAIVNAGNPELLGCFYPMHACIDNVIHSAAGMQLRADCARLMAAQGHEEECGGAKLTCAYNLPSRYVLHTVGPMVRSELTEENRGDLRSCYASCLNLAAEAGLHSVAFCCISTGVFNFPHEEAAEIATGAVLSWKFRHKDYPMAVVFNTFSPSDTELYRNILRLSGIF